MKTLASISLLIFTLLAAPLAQSQNLEVFDQDKEIPTLKWQRVIGEHMLREQIVAALTPLAKDQRFNVFVAIRLKSIKGRNAKDNREFDPNSDATVDLGKLGTAGPAINDDVIAKGQLWAQVEYIKTDVVLYDYAPAEQVKMMESITRKIVMGVVPNWRAGINVTAPKFEFVQWFYDRKVLVGVLSAAVVFCFLGAFLMLNFFYSQRYRHEELQRPVSDGPRYRDLPVGHRDAAVVDLLPKAEPIQPASFTLPPQLENATQFDPREWISLIEANPSLGAVLANIVPPEAAARVFAALPVELVKKTTELAMTMTEDDVLSKTDDLKKVVAAMAARKAGNSFLDHAVELVGRVGPHREGVFFANLIQAGRLDLLEEAARKYFPAHLIPGLPSELLHGLLNTMTTDARVELVIAADEKYRGQLLQAIGEKGTKVREYADQQVKELDNDPIRANEIKKRAFHIWWDFVKLVRRTIVTDRDFARATDFLLNPWLEEQKKNAKKKGRENAA